jgi:hypothetical protein
MTRSEAKFAGFVGQFNAAGRKQPFLNDPDDIAAAVGVIPRTDPSSKTGFI